MLNRLAKLEKEIKELKKAISKDSSKKKLAKPQSIDECKSQEEISKFKISEIKEWISDNEIDVKNLDDKYKEDLVKIVWKNLKKNVESDEEYSPEDEDESEDAGEGYEWYYY